ncbi:MAG: hypothetical protein V4622_03330 [Bacteroidota bacterium]
MKIYLLLPLLVFLFSCGNSFSKKNKSKDSKKAISDKIVSIDTFSFSSTEIEGCSCYFSNDSTEFQKGQYIYVNDFAETWFLKINGILTEFKQIDFKEVNENKTIARAKSDKYEVVIEVFDGLESGDESMFKTGKIKIKPKNGKTTDRNFYGECGC